MVDFTRNNIVNVTIYIYDMKKNFGGEVACSHTNQLTSGKTKLIFMSFLSENN